MMYSGEMRLAEAVPTTMALLATLCKRISFYAKFSEFGVPLDSTSHPNTADWESWVCEETKRRLFYFAWVGPVKLVTQYELWGLSSFAGSRLPVQLLLVSSYGNAHRTSATTDALS